MPGKELITDGQLTIAMLNNIVQFKDSNEIADKGGQIDDVVDDAVKCPKKIKS